MVIITDEIKNFVIEMVESLEYKKKSNPKEEELQKKFKDLFAFNVQRLEYLKEIKKPYYKLHGQIRFRFSTKFLRENENWLR